MVVLSPARSVHLKLSAQPAGARLSLDGAPIASNPYEADVPLDGTVHQIAAQASGYEPRQVPATFNRDVTVDVALAPTVPPPSQSVSVASAPGHPKRAPAPAALAPGLGIPPAQPRRPIEDEDPYKQ